MTSGDKQEARFRSEMKSGLSQFFKDIYFAYKSK